MKPPKQRLTFALLAGCVVLGAALRLAFARSGLFYPDSTLYLSLARNMTRGDFLHSLFRQETFHQPLYSLLVAGLSLLGLRLETAGVAVSLLAGLGLIVVLFLLGRRLGGAPTGLAAALLAAVDPQLVRYSTEILTEMLFLLLYYLLMLVVLRAPAPRPGWFELRCGLLAALAFAARFVGISALLMAVVWIFALRLAGGSPVFRLPQRNRAAEPGAGLAAGSGRPVGAAARRQLPAALLAALLVAGGFAAAISPQLLRIRLGSGEWSLTGFRLDKPRPGGFPVTAEARRGESPALGGWLAAYRGLRAENAVDLDLPGYLREFLRVFWRTVSPLWPLLALWGVIFWTARCRGAGAYPFLYLLSWILPPLGITFIAQSASGSDEVSRYLIPILPALLLAAAHGLAAVPAAVEAIGDRRTRHPAREMAPGGLSAEGDARPAARAEDLFPPILSRFSFFLPLALAALLSLGVSLGPYRRLADEIAGRAGSHTWIAGYDEVADFVRGWAARAGKEKPVLMDRKPFAAYLSGSWWAVLPDAGLNNLFILARNSRTDLLVIDSAAVALYRPDLTPLVSGEQVLGGLRLVYHRLFPGQTKIIALYQVLDPRAEGREGLLRRDGLDDFPDRTPEEHCRLGRGLLEQGQVHLAGLHFRRALKQRPDHAEASFLLGGVYFRESLYNLPDRRDQGVFHKAIRCYQEAARLEPRSSSLAAREIAALERNLGRQQGASVYRQLGEEYLADGRPDEALAAFRRSSALDPAVEEVRRRIRELGQGAAGGAAGGRSADRPSRGDGP